MPSPFPGMDPYLEGYLWPDVHHALANKIRQFLTPKLRPRYAARLEIYLVEDLFPESEIGIIYPDVEVIQLRQQGSRRSSGRSSDLAAESSGQTTLMPAPLTLPILQPLPVRIATLEIRDSADNLLVTCLEILSPVNKREPGLTSYRQKRQRLYQAGIHLLELDLLRRGIRPFAHPYLPEVAYAIALTRQAAKVLEVWPVALSERLPIVPVPLRSPDPDLPLDLSAALAEVYDEAAYDLSLTYQDLPPPPALTEAEQDWVWDRLQQWR